MDRLEKIEMGLQAASLLRSLRDRDIREAIRLLEKARFDRATWQLLPHPDTYEGLLPLECLTWDEIAHRRVLAVADDVEAACRVL